MFSLVIYALQFVFFSQVCFRVIGISLACGAKGGSSPSAPYKLMDADLNEQGAILFFLGPSKSPFAQVMNGFWFGCWWWSKMSFYFSYFRLSFRGRRSHGGFSLNILDYGVFWASKYKANMFLSLIGPEVLSLPSRSSKKSLFIWAFQWFCKRYILFSYLTKLENKEFPFLITCKFSVDLLDLKTLFWYIFIFRWLSQPIRELFESSRI